MRTPQADGGAMLAELIPPKILPRVLSRFDLIAIYFALIFGSYGAAQMAGKGWAGISMMTLAAVTFLLPCALASYELGTLFPGEGGIYVWAHKAFGPIHGFVAGWLSWAPIFLLLPLGTTTIVAHLQVALHQEWPLWLQVLAQMVIVWLIVGLSVTGLRFSQGYVKAIFFVSLGTAVTVFIVGMLRHTPANPITSDIVSLDLGKYGALYSAAILWLLGVEVPFNMGAEVKGVKRSAGAMMLWGSLALLVAYYLGIVGILYTTPVSAIDGTTGVAKAAAVLSGGLGSLVAFAICIAVSSQDIAYMNAYSRLLFVSGIERRLPAVMAQVNERTRVPVPSMLVQGLGASLVILVFSTQTQLATAFNLYVAALVTVWCSALFYLYAGVVKARLSYADLYKRNVDSVWKIPGGIVGVCIVAIWGAFFNAVAIYYVFALPWSTDISATAWRLWLVAIGLVVILSGVWIFLGSRKRVASVRAEEELARYARFETSV
jgi:amino acid transporter